MAGFRNIREWCLSASDDGKNYISMFRKTPSASTITVAGQWFDYGVSSGIPLANYYAAAPGTATYVDAKSGLNLPSILPNEKLFLSQLTTMTRGASPGTITNEQQLLFLCDYLLYYPFFDMDDVGTIQTTAGSNTLTRYTTGLGVQMVVVGQAPSAGGGRYTITYTNSDGVPGRVTPPCYCPSQAPVGSCVASVGAAAGITPFVPLQAGDKGVRSVQSLTVEIANGGLVAVVLVKPIQMGYANESSREVMASGVSNGDATQIDRITMMAGAPEIYPNAVLGFLSKTLTGTIAFCSLVGWATFVWR